MISKNQKCSYCGYAHTIPNDVVCAISTSKKQIGPDYREPYFALEISYEHLPVDKNNWRTVPKNQEFKDYLKKISMGPRLPSG